MGEHNKTGRIGEAIAERFLVRCGYEILERNYRYQKAEIDLIIRKGSIVAFVEVKTRTNDFLEELSLAVNKKKIQRIVNAADHFVTSRNLDVEVRFDIITVVLRNGQVNLEHLKDAYYHF